VKPIVIPFSSNSFDQWRLSQVGGQIAFTKYGKPVFRFQSQQQYNEYLRLNSQRKNFSKGV
jgi:hypothetical protein